MRKSIDLQTLTATPYGLAAAARGLWQWFWPPLVALLLGFLLLGAAFAAPWHIRQDVGTHAPLLGGLYAEESNQEFTYAYTRGEAVLALPNLGRGSFAVSLTAGAPAEHSARGAVLRVGAAAYPLGSLQPVRAYHLMLPNSDSGDADIHIESEAAPVGTDARPLGLLLDKLSVQTLQPMGIPSHVRNTVVVVTTLLWLILLPNVRAARRRLPLLLGGVLATCWLFILARGTWDVPVWWLYRFLGVLGLGLLLLRIDGRTRLAMPRFWYVPVIAGTAVLLLSRRPDSLFNAQFWAEDGSIWYYDAYTYGPLNALLMPHTGYFQTLPRLVAAFSLRFPLEWAPLIFSLVAIGIQILPVLLLLSSRYASVIPVFQARLLLALAYIAVPNAEVHVNLTNAQWHLALTAAMLVLAQPSARWGWRCFDIAAVALTAVSGPFCIILAPMCLLRSFVRRDRWLLCLGLVLSAGALIQLTAFVLQTDGPRLRDNVPLGASPTLFSRIVGGQIVAQTVLGPEGFGWLSTQTPWMGLLPLLLTAGGLGLLGYALWKGPLELRLFTLFAAWIMVGGLVSPVTGSTSPQWEVLALPGVGLRYWRIPVLAFIVVLGYLAYRAPARAVRRLTAVVLVAAALGNLYGWSYYPWADVSWRENAREFAAAAPGTSVSLPIQPHGWKLSLVKH